MQTFAPVKLICLTLALLSIDCAQAEEKEQLFVHVNGYTPTNHDVHSFNALLVREGKVLAVGDKKELLALSPRAQIIDGKGATILPGLIDAHGHLMNLGEERLQLDLRGVRSKAEALEKVRAYRAQHPDLAWIVGRGWNQELWADKQFPLASDLDAISAQTPIVLTRIDGHASWVNSAALKHAAIDTSSADPVGGKIMRLNSGAPSGVLIDNASELVYRHMPAADSALLEQRLHSAMSYLRTLGITAVHDAGVSLSELAVEEKLAAQGKLSLRIYAMLMLNEQSAEALAMQAPRRHLYHDFLDVRAVKIVADGALGSRGAALFDDYADAAGQRGFLLAGSSSLWQWMQQADNAGWQVNVHAIGDWTNHQVLDHFALLAAKNGLRDSRHRIEHAQVLQPEDIARMAELNVTASMQPIHAVSDMHMAPARLGAQRLAGAYAWRSLLQQGVRIAAGSDFPVELANPFFGLHAAVTRQDEQNNPRDGWLPNQVMTREEALRAFTLDAAYAAHNDATQGSLSPGKWADFIFIDKDYFSVPASEIRQIKVLQTWVAGKRVF